MSSRHDLRIAVVAAFCIAFLSLSPDSASGADLLEWPQGVRSWGMGMIGAADAGDPANVFFNPAIVASAEGLVATGTYFKIPYWGAENAYSFNAGLSSGARAIPGIGSEWRFGASFRYARNTMEFEERTIYLPEGTRRVLKSEELMSILNVGAGRMLGGKCYGGIGFSWKPWRYEITGSDPYTANKTAFDVGVIFTADVVKREEYKLSTSAGVSFNNLIGHIEPGWPLPEKHRFGLGVEFESASSGFLENRFGVKVPVFSAAADFEFLDNLRVQPKYYQEKTTQWGVGTELSFLRILSVRVGIIEDENDLNEYGTFGLGLAFTTKRWWARADFATINRGLWDENRYGLALGLSLL